MRRSIAFVFLFVAGCETGQNPDTVAARELVRSLYSNVDATILVVEEPEYATIPKIRRGSGGTLSDKSAACGVRVKFEWRYGGRTTHDDWVVWVTSDHKAVDWVGNPDGDKWRPYVRSLAK